MATTNYAVSFDPSVNNPARNGVQGAVVVAGSSADAKAMLKALYGDEVTIGWDNASYTAMAAGSDLSGWSLRVALHKANGDLVADVTVTGDDTNNTVDEIAALAVTALNATAGIANAGYNTSTNVLTVAGTADNLGDGHVFAAFMPPNSSVAVPGFLGTIVDQGSSGDAVTVALAADSYTVPSVTKAYGDTSN